MNQAFFPFPRADTGEKRSRHSARHGCLLTSRVRVQTRIQAVLMMGQTKTNINTRLLARLGLSAKDPM